ncbi:hypothetical protein ACFVRU_39890, partial [Streptomyces sp. NPDC057927]
MGRIITELMSSATAYQDTVRAALPRGRAAPALSGGGGAVGGDVFMTSGDVVTVGPNRGEASGGGDQDDDDEELLRARQEADLERDRLKLLNTTLQKTLLPP